MKPKHLYVFLCFIGVAVPYSQFVPWLLQQRSLRGFLPATFVNRISTFFVLDVLVSAAVLVVFMAVERGRGRAQHVWAPILALVTVGVSLALPVFLYLREVELEKTDARAARA